MNRSRTNTRVWTLAAAFTLALLMMPLSSRQASAEDHGSKRFVPPVVFQAAGPTTGSIQGTVDEFRAALGGATTATGARSAVVAARSTGTAGALQRPPLRGHRLPSFC